MPNTIDVCLALVFLTDSGHLDGRLNPDMLYEYLIGHEDAPKLPHYVDEVHLRFPSGRSKTVWCWVFEDNSGLFRWQDEWYVIDHYHAGGFLNLKPTN